MKKIIVLIAMAGLFVSCAHHKIVPIEERQVQFVHEVDLTKDQIFDRTMKWFALTFVDSKSVLKVENRDGGQIVGKAGTYIKRLMAIPIGFSVCVDIKDAKYRTTYKDFTIGTIDLTAEYEIDIIDIKREVERLDKELLAHLKTNDDNW